MDRKSDEFHSLFVIRKKNKYTYPFSFACFRTHSIGVFFFRLKYPDDFEPFLEWIFVTHSCEKQAFLVSKECVQNIQRNFEPHTFKYLVNIF
jgi:hypothetical protein